MAFFKRKDPICGMREEKGKGISDEKFGKWFCSNDCLDKFSKDAKSKPSGCCG